MPTDLRNPEGMFPFYYDSRYEPGTNQFDPGIPSLRRRIKEIAEEYLGHGVDNHTIREIEIHLTDKGTSAMNWGDEPFKNEVCKHLKKLKLAKRVIRCLI